jgi:exodeoxyribonuclease-3
MGVQRKLAALETLAPDVAVVPECAATVRPPSDCSFAWAGRPGPRGRGVGVFGFNGFTVTRNEAYDDRLEWVAPIDISGPVELTLLAVWAMNHRAKSFYPLEPRISQVQQALTVYRSLIGERPAVIAGDFNNAIRWDRGKPADWAATVERLEAAGLVSAYHAYHRVLQGQEPQPTIYWRDRRADGPTHHIDYCFVPRTWKIVNVALGSFAEWVGSGLSDHVPVIVDVEPTIGPSRA